MSTSSACEDHREMHGGSATEQRKDNKTGGSAIEGESTKEITFTVQQSDAVQAYCQAKMQGTDTWIELPKHRWKPGWREQYWTPMVPLRLALYGHPCSGAYWERRCDGKILSEGFRKICDGGEWRSCYFHDELRTLLAVYVDDF